MRDTLGPHTILTHALVASSMIWGGESAELVVE